MRRAVHLHLVHSRHSIRVFIHPLPSGYENKESAVDKMSWWKHCALYCGLWNYNLCAVIPASPMNVCVIWDPPFINKPSSHFICYSCSPCRGQDSCCQWWEPCGRNNHPEGKALVPVRISWSGYCRLCKEEDKFTSVTVGRLKEQ